MASTIDKIKNDIIEAMNASQKKTSAYDTEAEIVRVDGNTAWVHIAGGVSETPVALTINAQKGDKVQVRVSNEGAWLTGNATSPPTDDATAIKADAAATMARAIANSAMDSASVAADAAGRAVASAHDAEVAAGNAQTAAESAQESADSALVSLSTVEDVVGVLNWITAHGTMTANGNTALDPAKVYFVRDNSGDYQVGSYRYSIVSEPKAADRTSYYTLSVDESVQNYVATHVAVNTEGLWLIPDQNGTPTTNGKKILIATGAGSSYTTAGTYILDRSSGVDKVIASFRANGATIGETVDGKSRTEIATNGLDVLQRVSGADEEIAHFGYGSAYNASGVLVNAPYFTFGNRKSGSAVGAYSFVQGQGSASGVSATAQGSSARGYTVSGGEIKATALGAHAEGEAQSGYSITASGVGSHAEGGALYGNILASGQSSHAEGDTTTASGIRGHAEGFHTTASGANSHSEGGETTASGDWSHSEGNTTTASGQNAHAQNLGTVADQGNQTAIGSWNTKNLTDNLFVIGNGTGDTARSNAFKVSKTGDTETFGLLKSTKSSNTVSIGSQNNSWCHIYNSASIPFIFNNTIATTAGDLGTSSYKWSKGYFKGQIFTSFKDSVAMGSYGSAQTTVGGLVGEVRYSSGCSGSVSIGTAYTANGVTIATGWYNFSYMPHRSGGANGSASGDNQDYGNLFLFGMNNTNGRFIVRVSSGSIAEVTKIITSKELQSGSIAATSVGANAYVDVGVTFSPTMKSTPNVIVGLRSDSTAGAIGSISVAVLTGSVSTTGFTCRIFNAGSATRVPGANWIAME